ncbi:MAG: MotA/TolQ/ExbB proton channel family protein [Peptococcaceae bacterium]|nr:MotA/TolQ/ExbB proton channel family protein [Peptococcaceae bacterium]
MVIPGSEYIVKILHAISQSLLIPGIVILFLLLIVTCVQVGVFAAEIKDRRPKRAFKMADALREAGPAGPGQSQKIKQLIEKYFTCPELIESLSNLLDSGELSFEEKKLVAQDILEAQEIKTNRRLQKTDLIARLGPLLGLMLTLIPLGPGLAALGQGDIHALAQAIIVAFDATVVGIATGGAGFFLSRIRRGWYDQDLSALEILLNFILGREGDAGQAEKEVAAGRGN